MRGAVQGAVAFVKASRVPPRAPVPGSGARRGSVRYFSYRSRKRLAIALHRMRWPPFVLFLTLTFDPQRFPRNWKYELHRFCVTFLKAFPGWGIVWKLEFHQSGYPHFHLLLIPPSGVRAFIPHSWLEEIWGHGWVWVERVFQNRIRGYLLKYALKGWGPGLVSGGGGDSLDLHAISETGGPGRFWGIRGSVAWASVRRMEDAPDWARRMVAERLLELRAWLRRELGLELRGWVAVLLPVQVT